MKKVYYNKLVRDRIQSKIEDKGVACSVRPIDDVDEFIQELLKKVTEESGALARSRTRTEFLSEYADLMVVLDALTAELEITEADIKVALSENVEKKGLYKLRHYLHWSEDSGYQSNETPQGMK